MKNLFFEKRCRYSIRKLSIGACSLMIGKLYLRAQLLPNKSQSLKQLQIRAPKLQVLVRQLIQILQLSKNNYRKQRTK